MNLRAYAVARSLRPAATLTDALERMRFVQLDPIRAPARAADLILRQRVAGYRAGDLDRAYPSLALAEDYVHVYGVMPVATRELLHPRRRNHRFRVEREHPRLAKRILAHVAAHGETHPRDLDSLGRHRTINGWGSESAATTRVLEALHFRGELRVARRVGGVKVYALSPPADAAQPAAARAMALVKLLLDLYAPISEPSFRQLVRMITESSVPESLRMRTFERLRKDEAVERIDIDGVTWWRPAGEAVDADPPREARFLAPFDPIVWDRRRFTRFWGWDYRLEAYTPPAKRKFGYYALPLLWRDDVIGWANAAIDDATLSIAVDYVRKAPRDAVFRRELEAEAERLRDSVGAPRVALLTR
jgi:uncharacterized protein YcaQ